MGAQGHLEPYKEEGGASMKWTWPYILQQVVLLGAWGLLMRAVWREVREVMREEKTEE